MKKKKEIFKLSGMNLDDQSHGIANKNKYRRYIDMYLSYIYMDT